MHHARIDRTIAPAANITWSCTSTNVIRRVHCIPTKPRITSKLLIQLFHEMQVATFYSFVMAWRNEIAARRDVNALNVDDVK